MAVSGFEPLDFHGFHQCELPARLAAGHGRLAAEALAGLPPLAFRLPGGEAYTYVPAAGGVEVVAGDESAGTVMELEHETWEGVVHDYESAPGLLYGGRVACRRGDAMHFVAWEPALRAMFTGRPLFDPQAPLLDRDGAPLDVGRSFAPGDDEGEMAHFLRTAGYLCVRGLFARDEIARFRAEADELMAEARKGDKLSWWAKNARGEEVLCRVTRAGDKPHLATLYGEPRLRRLADLADQRLEVRQGEGGSGVTIILKNPEIAEGLSDLPWHRDCGMGGHALMCPILICSVFLTPANRDTGELRFLPGSWRATCGFREATDPSGPQGVSFEAEPGDVTMHYGDVMHAAPPPARSGPGAYRISATTGFSRPDARNHLGGTSYNDVLHRREDGQVEHLSQVAKRA